MLSHLDTIVIAQLIVGKIIKDSQKKKTDTNDTENKKSGFLFQLNAAKLWWKCANEIRIGLCLGLSQYTGGEITRIIFLKSFLFFWADNKIGKLQKVQKNTRLHGR